MANIGSFKKVGNEFQGEIVTLSVQTKGVRIVPETSRGNDNAPSHRVYVGRAIMHEFYAEWTCPAFAESVFKFTRPASRTEAG